MHGCRAMDGFMGLDRGCRLYGHLYVIPQLQKRVLIDEGIYYIARTCKLIRCYVYEEYIRSTCGSGS